MKLAIASENSNKNWLFYPGLAASLLLITVLMTVPYISSQQAFLGGDINDGFYQFGLQISDTFRQSPGAIFQLIYRSLERDYNRLFSLPLIPFFLLFGNSYLVYVISLAIVYLLPFTLVIGGIATQLIPIYPKTVFASTTLITVLITPNWVTILQGYPDISAALIVVLAIWVCLHGIGREFVWLFPYRWQVPVLGCLLGIAVLLRRHFAYAVLAILAAICVYSAIVFLLQLRSHPPGAWLNLRRFALQLSLIIATSLIVLLLLAWKFTLRAFTEDYVSLYNSWSRPWSDVVGFYGGLYGWSIWVLCITGWIAGIYTRILSLPIALWLSTFGGFSIGLWISRLRYTETYYALHFAPFILLGLSAFFWVIQLKLSRNQRSLFWILFTLLLTINALFGLTFFGNHIGQRINPTFRPILATSFPPPVRTDYAQITQLVNFLREVAPSQEPIFVIYTAQLPMHLLRAAERTIYGESHSILNFKQGTITDSDGVYPIRDLLMAKFVVFTQPFTAWNEPEQQSIKAVFDTFSQKQEFTQDFEQLPQQFVLSGETIVTLYRRVQNTPVDRTVRTLHAMRSQVNKPLGKQLDWIALSQTIDSSVKQNRKTKKLNLSAVVTASSQEPVASFLYLGTLPEQAELKGRVALSKSCTNGVLTVTLLNQQGQVVGAKQTQPVTHSFSLDLPFQGKDASYLLLQVEKLQSKTAATEPCQFKINHVQVSTPTSVRFLR